VRKQIVVTMVAALTLAVVGTTQRVVAQTTPPALTASPNQNVPVQIQVVISRYQGDKRVSSLPYVLTAKTSGNRTNPALLRLGARVPIRTQETTPASDGKPATTTSSVRYENVGTNIDCNVTALTDGRIELAVSINESSVITDPQELRNIQGGDSYPVFRSYQSTNSLFLRDGETNQFTAATDRTTGEVVRVEVKVTVMK
jgi:Bacterial type II and III secretion system protein